MSARRSRRAIVAAQGLLSPSSGVVGQGVRFAVAGGVVTLIYAATTLLLADVFGVPFEIALAIGFCTGLAVHFSLQRFFVWVHHEEFALPLHHQAGRYLIAAGVQYGLTAASTAVLPSLLGVSTEVVYLVTVAAITCVNFLVFRHGIFHARAPADGEPPRRRGAGPAGAI
jgi:putative flippase GtrA